MNYGMKDEKSVYKITFFKHLKMVKYEHAETDLKFKATFIYAQTLLNFEVTNNQKQ